MPKQVHLALDVSWTRVETAWAMPGSWVDRHYPDIGLFEDIAPDRRAQIVRGDRPRRMFWGTDITRMTCAGGNASRCSPRNYPG
jgi:hypothetical protein